MFTETTDPGNPPVPALFKLASQARSEAPRRFALWGVSGTGDFTEPLAWGMEFPKGGALCTSPSGDAVMRSATAERALALYGLARPLALVWIDSNETTPTPAGG